MTTRQDYVNQIKSHIQNLATTSAETVAIHDNTSLGRTTIGTERKAHLFLISGQRSLALTIRTQEIAGTTDEKIFFQLKELELSNTPSILVWNGDGFRLGVKNLLNTHPKAIEFDPSNSDTHANFNNIIAQHLGWWSILV